MSGREKDGSLALSDIAVTLAEQTGLSPRETDVLLKRIVSAMQNSLAKGEEIQIRGLGSFRVRTRQERWARDIRKGSPVFVPAHRSAVFVPGRILKKGLQIRKNKEE